MKYVSNELNESILSCQSSDELYSILKTLNANDAFYFNPYLEFKPLKDELIEIGFGYVLFRDLLFATKRNEDIDNPKIYFIRSTEKEVGLIIEDLEDKLKKLKRGIGEK